MIKQAVPVNSVVVVHACTRDRRASCVRDRWTTHGWKHCRESAVTFGPMDSLTVQCDAMISDHWVKLYDWLSQLKSTLRELGELLPSDKPDQLVLSAFIFGVFKVIHRSTCVTHWATRSDPSWVTVVGKHQWEWRWRPCKTTMSNTSTM